MPNVESQVLTPNVPGNVIHCFRTAHCGYSPCVLGYTRGRFATVPGHVSCGWGTSWHLSDIPSHTMSSKVTLRLKLYFYTILLKLTSEI